MLKMFFKTLSVPLIVLLISTIQITAAKSNEQEENLFKAAFVYNFAKFTSWPDSVWNKSEASLNLCIIGKDSLTEELKRLTGKIIMEHQLSVKEITRKQSAKTCHLLYISTSEKNHYLNIIQSINNSPVLTISEIKDFAKSGGIIELKRIEQRTRIVINLNTSNKAGLNISSRLLILADVIENEGAM